MNLIPIIQTEGPYIKKKKRQQRNEKEIIHKLMTKVKEVEYKKKKGKNRYIHPTEKGGGGFLITFNRDH